MQIQSKKIRVLMARSGLTQSKLSEMSGISRQSISTILSRGSCSPKNAGKLAEALGVDVLAIVVG